MTSEGLTSRNPHDQQNEGDEENCGAPQCLLSHNGFTVPSVAAQLCSFYSDQQGSWGSEPH